MRGDDHRVIPLFAIVACGDESAVQTAPYATHGRSKSKPVAEPRAKRFDIGLGSALDGAPRRPAGDLEQTVIVAKTDEGGGGIVADFADRHRPDRRRHRIEVVLAKSTSVTATVEIVT